MEAKQVVSEICTHHCSYTCYKNECARGKWFNPELAIFGVLAKVGEDTQCPLMQFEAEIAPTNPGPFGHRSNLTYEDTWKACEQCQYGGKDEIPADNLGAHCMDCPVFAIREHMTE